MNRVPSRLLALSAALVGSLGLSACALLATPDPVQLHRFGAVTEDYSGVQAEAGSIEVSLRRVEFPLSSEGDRILSVTGTEAAYVAGARWVEPAQDLFTAGLEGAFSARGGRVRLLGPRELARGTLALDVDVRNFEARYTSADAAPVVVITARARLIALPGREIAAERVFTVERPAGDNRVSAIVEAFDEGTRDLTGQLVDWVETSARP
jgi:cholesterol transport system auxiliary component